MIEQEIELQTLVLLEYNPGKLMSTVQDMILDGWLLDEERPMNQVGFYWEVGMVRDSTSAQRAKDEAELNKPSRADIMKKAREAKAEKRRNQQKEKTE